MRTCTRHSTALFLSLVLLVQATAANTSVSTSVASTDGSSSSIGDGIFTLTATVLPFCNATNFRVIYYDANVTACTIETGFSMTNPNASLNAINASDLCWVYPCQQAYFKIAELVQSSDMTDCYLTRNTTLIDGIYTPLATGGCANFITSNTTDDYVESGSFDNSTFISTPFPSASASASSSDATKIAIIVSLAVGCLLAFTVVVVAFVWYKRQQLKHVHYSYGDPLMDVKLASIQVQNRRRHQRTSANLDDTESSDLFSSNEISHQNNNHSNDSSQHVGSSLWSDQDLLPHHMRKEDLEDIRIIGTGAHGVVFLVRYRQTRLLASKCLVKDHLTREKTRALITEIKLASTLEHPCIVQFVGASWTTEADLEALFEYMPNGDMCTYLAKTITTPEWNLEKLKMAMDIAEALVYVHSFSPPLVHRDLKSSNVLLAEDMRAKLSDFGVSRFQSDACTMTLGVGSGRWLAPEVMAGGGEYNQSCDVYSLGVVLSEMDTHRLPFSDLRSASGNPMAEVSILQLVTLGRLQPTFTETCPASLRAIALRCLAFNPKERPNAIEVSYTLRTIAKTEFGL